MGTVNMTRKILMNKPLQLMVNALVMTISVSCLAVSLDDIRTRSLMESSSVQSSSVIQFRLQSTL
jgi:hypothetical protein